MDKNKIKTGTLTVTKVDGINTHVNSDFHIDELFKIVHHMRSDLGGKADALKDMQRMGWPVPQKEFKKS